MMNILLENSVQKLMGDRILFQTTKLCQLYQLQRYAAHNLDNIAGSSGHTLHGYSEKPEPHIVDRDYIGPPDKKSNIRPFVRCIRRNETPLGSRFRLKQIEVEKWNQEFWTNHNERFADEKCDFMRLHKVAGNDEISAEQMSVFYKQFLDKNRRMHLLYNVSWYIKNFQLLMLALQLEVQNLVRTFKRNEQVQNK